MNVIGHIAFVDTETSGLWRKDLPVTDPSQPHMLQLACKMVTPDRRLVGSFSRIIRPEGWSIEPEAESTHGISEAFAHRHGVPLWIALTELRASVENASRIVGHNITLFDRLVIEASIARTGTEARWWRSRVGLVYDTQEAATPVLRLPSAFGDYKWPSLQEAVRYFADGEPWASWESSHQAADDIEATEFVYWALQNEGG